MKSSIPGQLWKVEGMKLLNKVDGFESDDIWVLIPEGRMAYIENQTQNQVLTEFFWQYNSEEVKTFHVKNSE